MISPVGSRSQLKHTKSRRVRRRVERRAGMCDGPPSAPDLLSWLDVFAGQLSACPAPANSTEASELAELLCADAQAQATHWSNATLEACLQCAPGAPGRAGRVTEANFSASGNVFCCNILDRRFDDEGRVICTSLSSPLLLMFPLLLFAAALIVTFFRISPQSRAVRKPLPL
jgi:hypothetical protein